MKNKALVGIVCSRQFYNELRLSARQRGNYKKFAKECIYIKEDQIEDCAEFNDLVELMKYLNEERSV